MTEWLMRPEQIPSRFGPGLDSDEPVASRLRAAARPVQPPQPSPGRGEPLLRRLTASIAKPRHTSVATW